MKKDSISLIIPMFNVESFIKKCLTSIVNQTVAVDEVILINDASTDNSLNIAKSFKAKIKNFRLIDLKTNKGVSSARNLGVEKAIGNYIFFLDSDDWIEKDAISTLKNVIKEDNYDLILFGFNDIVNGIQNRVVIPLDTPNELFYRLHLSGVRNLSSTVWSMLILRKMLIENKITSKDFEIEDVPHANEITFFAKNIRILQKVVVNYRVHAASRSRQINAKKIEDNLLAHVEIKLFLEKNNVFETYKKEYIIRFLVFFLYPNFKLFFKLNPNKIPKKLKQKMKEIRKSNLLSKNNLVLIRELYKQSNNNETIKEAYTYLYNLKYHYFLLKTYSRAKNLSFKR